MGSVRKKSFEVSQQLTFITDGVSAFVDRVRALPSLSSYALVIHDKDISSDGSPAAPHLHCVVTFTDKLTVKKVSAALNVPEQCVCFVRVDVNSSRAYLVHANAPDKFQYEPSSVVASFDYVEWLKKWKASRDLGVCDHSLDLDDPILSGIVAGKISRVNLTDFVSASYYLDHRSDIELAFEYASSLRVRDISRSLDVVYLYGPAGVGKTYLSRQLAGSRSVYFSSGGSNPLDDYCGQDVIVLDDFRAESLDYVSLLKLLDPFTLSRAGARYHNVDLSSCSLIVITSVFSPDELYSSYFLPSVDSRDQLMRRLSRVGHLNEDFVEWYRWDGRRLASTHLTTDNPCRPFRSGSVLTNSDVADWLRSCGFAVRSLVDAVCDTGDN